MSQNIVMMASAIALTMSLGIDLNFNLIRHLLRQPYTSAIMLLLRISEVLSSFTLIGCISSYIAQFGLSVSTDIAAIATATAGAIIASIVMSKRGSKLSPADLLPIKSLKQEIRNDVRKELRVLKDEIKNLTDESYNLSLSLSELREASSRQTAAIDTLTSSIKLIANGYNTMAKEYREEAYKRELVTLQLSEITRIRQELENRRKRNVLESALKETSTIMHDLGFDVEVHSEPGMPAMILKIDGKPVAVGAHRTFALDNKKPRRIVNFDMIRTEADAAARLKLPLAIIVTNVKNGRRWATIIPSEKAASFEYVITPDELWLNTAEAEEACQRSLQTLKEEFTHADA